MKLRYTWPVVHGFIAAAIARVYAMFVLVVGRVRPTSRGSAMLNGAWRCPNAVASSGTRAIAPPPGDEQDLRER